jgi:predicted small lipoprotein YifL
MPPLLTLLALTAIAGCGGAIPDYFPMTAGNEWRYRQTRYVENGDSTDAGVLFMRVIKTPDPISAVVQYNNDSRVEIYSKTKGYLSATGSVRLGQDRTNYLLRLPPVKGEKWTLYAIDDETLDDIILLVYRVDSIIDVRQNGVIYQDVAVVDCENNDGTLKMRYYWAPDVGLLKRETFVREKTLDWTPLETITLEASRIQTPDAETKQRADDLTLEGAMNRETYLTDRELR